MEFYWARVEKRRKDERNILEAEMAVKRTRSSQRLKMLDWMMERLRVKDGKQLGKIARDRKRWKESAPQ